MTRNEAIEALEEMIEWGDSYEVDYGACEMAIDALKQEPMYCDRNICINNEYNGIGCEECEATKSQKPNESEE